MGDVVDDPEDRDHRRRQDRGLAGLVVEADVAAGHRDAELEAGVLEAAAGLGELPHHARVLRRAEVEAVADRERGRATRGDVAVGLGEGELRAGVRVEPGEAAVAVGGDGDPEVGVLVDADHAAVAGLGEHGVALHVAVVLVGDPRLVAQVRAGGQAQQRRAQLPGRARSRQPLGGVGLQRVLVVGAREGPVVRRAVVGDRARGDVDDALAVPVDQEPVAVGDLADDGGVDVPLPADGQEGLDVGRLDDRHHPLLRLAHQDLLGGERGVAQRDPVEVDVHAAVAGTGQLAGRAGQPRAAEVLDARDHTGREQLEGALDQQLLHERVADLDAGPLRRACRLEGLGGEDADAADAVAAGLGAVQDHLVADPARLGEVEVLVAQHADAQRVDERVAEVRRVEDRLAADVGQAQAVAVATHAGHDPGQHPVGVRGVERAEAQRVHHRDRTRAHREDVAHDAADAGGRTLVRLDVRRVVVALDLEGDGVALADVDDAGVLADAGEHLAPTAGGAGPGDQFLRDVGELLEVHLAGLVGAVLAPHHRVHRQLRAGRPAPEDLADPRVLVVLEPELGPRLLALGVRGRPGDGVEEGVGAGLKHGINLRDVVSTSSTSRGVASWSRQAQPAGVACPVTADELQVCS